MGKRVFVVFVPPNRFMGYEVFRNTILEIIRFGGFQPWLHLDLKNMSMLSTTPDSDLTDLGWGRGTGII